LARFLVRRVLQSILVILGVTIITFLALHVIPGDVAHMIGGEKATPEQIEQIRQQLGLDQPLYVQYWRFLSSAVRGDFGTSLQTHISAMHEVAIAFPLTFQLASLSLLVAAIFGIWLGTIAAVKRGTIVEGLSMAITLIGTSAPVFWIGILLLLFGGARLGWFPIGDVISNSIDLRNITHMTIVDSIITGNWQALGNTLHHLILPVFTLSLLPMAVISRITRAGMLEVLRQDYLRTARAKGVRESIVIFRHALPNAFLPVVTALGLQFGVLLSGAILTETVFNLPGLGRLVISSILFRDFPVIQAIVVVAAVAFTVINLLVDLSYAVFDPRIRYE